MSNTMLENQLLEALRYPTSIIRKEIDISTCKHGGEFQREDAECITCYQTPECEWLMRHDERANASDLSTAQLVAALQFACDYMHARLSLKRHEPAECPCEGCSWWRDAALLLTKSQAIPA